MAFSFTSDDLEQMAAHGIGKSDVDAQLTRYLKPHYIRLDRACTTKDGIRILGEAELNDLVETWDRNVSGKTPGNFVPASGAATRMFHSLHAALNDTDLASMEADRIAEIHPDVSTFLEALPWFAFFPELKNALKGTAINTEQPVDGATAEKILRCLLTPDGLNYPALPKGLLKFHQYSGTARTAFEEHLFETAQYAVSGNNTANLHFTVSPEHLEATKTLLAKAADHFSDTGIRFSLDFSFQKTAKDTIAVDPDNQPFRDDGGALVFRPAGHGALLDNLAEISFDPVFLKNIDNVCVDRLKPVTVRYKKALGGLLLKLLSQIHKFLTELESGVPAADRATEIVAFLKRELGTDIPGPIENGSGEDVRRFCFERLNRPLRVCGMVVNRGEPGGGPFWVRHKDGTVSAQIVEKTQIDPKDPGQTAILGASTHFNPVDLVCSFRDHRGDPYSLQNFSDPDAVIVAEKSHEGRPLKCLELPGLWNGAMAYWNTVFVEVPIETFNPVKTVLDLLRPAHQVVER